MHALLNRERYLAATTFVETYARPLDVVLLRHGRGEAASATVIGTLSSYQNADGGFGRGLEPDLATEASSAIATSIGLRLARRAGASAGDPMIRAALEWLAANLDREVGVWPIVPPAVEDGPHAPWWSWSPELSDSWNGFRFNPTAELLAALYHWRPAVDPEMLAIVEAAMLKSLQTVELLDSAFDLLCAARLTDTSQTPAAMRAILDPLLSRSLSEHDPDDPHLPVLELAPSPAAPLAQALASRIEPAIAGLIQSQDADGGWSPFWDWSSANEAAWTKAKADWRGWLTRGAIEALHAHGRVAAG